MKYQMVLNNIIALFPLLPAKSLRNRGKVSTLLKKKYRNGFRFSHEIKSQILTDCAAGVIKKFTEHYHYLSCMRVNIHRSVLFSISALLTFPLSSMGRNLLVGGHLFWSQMCTKWCPRLQHSFAHYRR